jgi:hypothetical protein
MIDAAGADFLMGGGSSKYAIGTLLEHSNSIGGLEEASTPLS